MPPDSGLLWKLKETPVSYSYGSLSPLPSEQQDCHNLSSAANHRLDKPLLAMTLARPLYQGSGWRPQRTTCGCLPQFLPQSDPRLLESFLLLRPFSQLS